MLSIGPASKLRGRGLKRVVRVADRFSHFAVNLALSRALETSSVHLWSLSRRLGLGSRSWMSLNLLYLSRTHQVYLLGALIHEVDFKFHYLAPMLLILISNFLLAGSQEGSPLGLRLNHWKTTPVALEMQRRLC